MSTLSRTLSYVPMSKLLAHFIEDEEVPTFQNHLDGWSFGDTMHTMIGNFQFFDVLLEYWLTERGAPMPDEVQDHFWALVDHEDFIDLET